MSDNFSIHKISFNKKIELDPESSNRFETQVRELLKKYPLANRAIKDLLKTEKTFNNSLGYIYEFLEDYAICNSCENKLNLCPKKRVGFKYEPYYDEYQDIIRLNVTPCVHLKSVESILRNIDQSYENKNLIYKEGILFAKRLREYSDKSTLLTAFKRFVKDLNALKENKTIKGQALFFINGEKIEQSFSYFLVYYAASLGIKSSLITFVDFLKDLNSEKFEDQNYMKRYVEHLKLCPFIIFENIDCFSTISDKTMINHLIPLFQYRKNKGLLTYCTLSTSSSLLTVGKKIGHYSETGTKLGEIFTSLFEKQRITDLDI